MSSCGKIQSGGTCAGSGWKYQLDNVGGMHQQLERTFSSNVGNSQTEHSLAIGTIQNPNSANNWSVKGGKHRCGKHCKIHRHRRHKKRGGNIISTASVPAVLWASQYLYKGKKHSMKTHKGKPYGKSRKTRKVRKTRRYF